MQTNALQYLYRGMRSSDWPEEARMLQLSRLHSQAGTTGNSTAQTNLDPLALAVAGIHVGESCIDSNTRPDRGPASAT